MGAAAEVEAGAREGPAELCLAAEGVDLPADIWSLFVGGGFPLDEAPSIC